MSVAYAYQILSKSIDKPTLGEIQDAIDRQKGRTPSFTENELRIYWPQAKETAFGYYNDALLEDDIDTGYIYILRSLSTETELKKYGKDFYKVGYTGGSVEKRISNAVNEPTYLCAPVQIVEKWRCTNINSKALETFLHKFLDVVRVKIKVNGKDKSQVASEWFNVPLGILEANPTEVMNIRYAVACYRKEAQIQSVAT